jgi:hypothetical protein
VQLNIPQDTETMFPNACALCGGDVHIRVVAGHAHSYCGGCHRLSDSPRLQVFHDGLKVFFAPVADA